MNAKTHAIPSSQPGQISSKVPGLVTGLLRQVTHTYFIAAREQQAMTLLTIILATTINRLSDCPQ